MMIVAFALISAFPDLAGLSGIGIGVGFFLIWGGRAVWLIRKQRRNTRQGLGRPIDDRLSRHL